ncbi:MAG: tRNA pseudouridine(13) synthase TruD [Anaerolineae bacterium]
MIDWRLPFLTADFPGIGGRLRVAPEDFIVEEIPAYAPSGEGEHTFFEVEKRNLSTPVLVQKIADALEIPPRRISYAGRKDARAVARQLLSAHFVEPERLLALDLDGARILWAKRHRNKLRIGHLRGNRFTIRVRDVHPEAEHRAAPILEVLRSRGVPNGYGIQRFGVQGDNHEIGWLLVQDDTDALRVRGIRSLPYRRRRFYVSAFQSAIFNRYLTERMERDLLDDLLPGDVAKKHDTGGMFTVEEVAVERPRVAAWEISATGPIYGYKMMPAREEAADLEARILAEVGLTLEDFRPVRARGTRRHVRYEPEGLSLRMDGSDVVVSFFAPKGSFATMLLRELMKPPAEPEEDLDEA